ncbi:MAG: hypothetical protein R3E34_14345 [Rhodocyclaceae bacterium]
MGTAPGLTLGGGLIAASAGRPSSWSASAAAVSFGLARRYLPVDVRTANAAWPPFDTVGVVVLALTPPPTRSP